MPIVYRIVRVRPNGSETVVQDVVAADITEEQQRRAEAFVATGARGNQRWRVYSSQDDGTFLPGDADLIWDSQVNV